MGACLHCGDPVAQTAAQFCCDGCAAAHGLLQGLGLERYYDRRRLDPEIRSLRPDADQPVVDFAARLRPDGAGWQLQLLVDGIHCAACVWVIETVLARDPRLSAARLNMTTRRLSLRGSGDGAAIGEILAPVLALGYRLVPYDPDRAEAESAREQRALLKAMAVAGFGAANVMLLSVSVWAGYFQGMGPYTRDLFHWISALIALPVAAYAGRPFFTAALVALKGRRLNMDVPISLAVLLALGMSVAETARGADHAYFDSALTLLFFLLIGRYLDRRARGRARAAAAHLLSLGAQAVTVLKTDGRRVAVAPEDVTPGATVLVAAGERVGVDGVVAGGRSDVDTGLITGESLPVAVAPGDDVFAGTLNISAPLQLTVRAAGENTVLAEIVRLMEAAERGRAGYVALADRVAGWYAPVVHLLALVTFAGWWLWGGLPWQAALLNAIAVLIVTCPCALALAVPVVQVIATGRLMRRGVLVKSASALERLRGVDMVVFDKTGTVTLGRPVLCDRVADDDLHLAAGMAAVSHHPLARALAAAAPEVPPRAGVVEEPGRGLRCDTAEGAVRLGSRVYCGVAEDGGRVGPELWLARPGRAPVRFAFDDPPRADAAAVVAGLKARGVAVMMLSGDRAPTVAAVAAGVGIETWRAGCSPADKVAVLEALRARGRRVVMVGDGLNDAPALAAASASLSPAGAAQISQNAADVVFQGARLAPVLETLWVADRADRLVKQNFGLSFLYNGLVIPLAVAGMVTPLIAAVAMSSSSILVIANALRLNWEGRR